MTNMTNREKRNLRRISILVTAQTKGNLEKLAAMAGYGRQLGRADAIRREIAAIPGRDRRAGMRR